ncbi:hypothetical protein [Actinoplanes utahensis]|uniref:Uncharacterized protein n=1 Tax=Actinoplanes utahensis TaxID=1869 RepID=A0A0A6WZ00_ACTUT|nr:hypothetical protein [Actinoplanes utahensis]KHD72997.1 hypothetical protein MB27_37075 [Actinoplanes utahensis]GIF35149.1 hypothetical protein Aut01nite_81350 [Actinoplanes utahensis]
MGDTGNEPAAADGPAEWTVAPVPADTGIHDETVDRTEHAPLAQWASRAGGRPHPEPAETQAPVDPWPLPIQGLNPPPGSASTDDLLTLQYDPFAPPRRPARTKARIAVAAAAVVLLAAAGGVTVAVWPSATPTAAPSLPAGAASTTTTATTGAAEAPVPPAAVGDDSGPMPTGPAAQGVPPRSVFDMDELCHGETYWPTLPRRTGNKAPHPVLIYGDQGGGNRMPYTMFNTYFRKPSKVEATWAPDDPATIRLVACVDRVAAGSKVRYCPASREPSSEKLTMFRASYRLHLYETATGRKLLDTRIAANDTECPYIGQAPADKKVYMEIGEPTLVATLRKFVER